MPDFPTQGSPQQNVTAQRLGPSEYNNIDLVGVIPEYLSGTMPFDLSELPEILGNYELLGRVLSTPKSAIGYLIQLKGAITDGRISNELMGPASIAENLLIEQIIEYRREWAREFASIPFMQYYEIVANVEGHSVDELVNKLTTLVQNMSVNQAEILRVARLISNSECFRTYGKHRLSLAINLRGNLSNEDQTMVNDCLQNIARELLNARS